MKTIILAASCVVGLLATSSAHSVALPATEPVVSGQIEQAQYRDWRGPGWDRPGWGRGRPRVACRVVSRRVVDMRGRVRIVRQEVCGRRF